MRTHCDKKWRIVHSKWECFNYKWFSFFYPLCCNVFHLCDLVFSHLFWLCPSLFSSSSSFFTYKHLNTIHSIHLATDVCDIFRWIHFWQIITAFSSFIVHHSILLFSHLALFRRNECYNLEEEIISSRAFSSWTKHESFSQSVLPTLHFPLGHS